MHSHKENTILISPCYDILLNKLQELNVNIIKTKPIEHLIGFEQHHADMQLLIIKDTVFISQDSIYLEEYLKDKYKVIIIDSLGREYPNNISLNALHITNKLICKKNSVAPQIIEYSKDNGIVIINTKQGYSRCSVLALNTGAIITADPSIYKSATSAGIKTLLISPGNIYLNENNYGFIGGASGVMGNTVLFFGDIKTHPDNKMITNFIENEGMKYLSLCSGILRDIGGIVNIK